MFLPPALHHASGYPIGILHVMYVIGDSVACGEPVLFFGHVLIWQKIGCVQLSSSSSTLSYSNRQRIACVVASADRPAHLFSSTERNNPSVLQTCVPAIPAASDSSSHGLPRSCRQVRARDTGVAVRMQGAHHGASATPSTPVWQQGCTATAASLPPRAMPPLPTPIQSLIITTTAAAAAATHAQVLQGLGAWVHPGE